MTPVKSIKPLGFPWETSDPFLFCAYHEDLYPKGNSNLGPAESLNGRNIGQDFSPDQKWRMYHGETVPGFPAHPHRGFETITIAQKGLVDHADSLGAAGRFGNGDVQWMTAGRGVQHSEMFPLLNQGAENPFLLFQIWLNLPKQSKYVPPYYAMIWQEDIKVWKNDSGATAQVITGKFYDKISPSPAPDSWASDASNEVLVMTITMVPGAELILPIASSGTNRNLFFYKGQNITISDQEIQLGNGISLYPERESVIRNGEEESHFLFLQGKPINEPVAQYGPFVMNTQSEVQAAIRDFQMNQFGGWPWKRTDQVHDLNKGRFALYADGREETK